MKTRKFLTIASAIAAVLIAGGTRDALAQSSIGVHFVNTYYSYGAGSSPDYLFPADSAGAPGYAQVNWNNFGSWGDSAGLYGTAVILTNSTGAATSLSIMWDSGGNQTSASTVGSPDGNLMSGNIYTWSPGAATALGNSVYSSPINDKPLVYVGGITSWWTNNPGAECYAVVIYTSPDSTYSPVTEGYVQSVSGNPFNYSMVEGTDLTPHIFARLSSAFSGTFVRATSTSSAAATSGANYMVLSGLTNDAIVIRHQCNGWVAGMNGFQLVPVYPGAPTALAPTISPSSTVYAGVPVTITEAAIPDPIHTNLWYQWQSDYASGGSPTNNILNATNAVYSFAPTNSSSTYTLNFQVVVTNIFGASTSSVVTLTVNPAVPPYTTTDTSPGRGDGSTNVYAFANGSVTFSAAFAGPVPITNLWQVDTGSGYGGILNATNGSVTVTNLQSTDDGNYRMLAGNVYGTTPSTPSPLTVQADPAAPSASEQYAYTVFTNNPVAYWRFNETTLNVVTNSVQAYDYSGHNLNATYGHGVAIFDNGLNSSLFPGFESVNPSVSLLNGYDGSFLSVPPLNLNTNTVTISMWINPNAVVGTYWGLLMWANTTNGDKAGFGFGGTQATNSSGFAVAELGYSWNSNSPATYGFNSGLYPPVGQWSFVSLVITPTNSTIYLYYTDGSGTHVSKAVQSITNSPEAFGGSGGTVWIGMDGYTGRTFDGYIDEVSVFNRSLSETQIQNLFRVGSGVFGAAPMITTDISPTNVNTFAGLTLKLTADGDGMPVPTFQWQSGTGGVFTNIINGGGVSGANSSTLSIDSPASANSLDYRLLLNNTYGSATSSICPVTLSSVPTDGLWTACYQVTNNDNGVGYVHASGHYTGQGVLGHGGFWNVIPGAGLYGVSYSYTSASDYMDDGSTHSGINCSIVGNGQSWVTGGAVYPHDDVRGLLSQYISFSATNLPTYTNAIVLSGLPNGTYNLAFHGINGQNCTHGTTFTVHGANGDQSASSVNQQFQAFRDGDTTVIITNVEASGGTLNVDMTPNNTNHTVDVNGVEIQFVSYSTPTAGFSASATNAFVGQWLAFYDQSSPVTNVVWDFGDGDVYTTTNGTVYHAYSASGTYTVSQTVTGPGGTNSVTETDYIVVMAAPSIGSVGMSAGSLVLSGAGGISGQQYRILTSTNVALPLANWTPVETNAFAADGSYSYTNSTPTNQASFFILVSP